MHFLFSVFICCFLSGTAYAAEALLPGEELIKKRKQEDLLEIPEKTVKMSL